ncbi:CHAT domain-containing protein, partial [Kocuria arenosa]|uniref:CHAT domain-containing protein n=1 Tax=Kocuria arenosa TaxID=3071446 RepID=UPI0034D6E26A
RAAAAELARVLEEIRAHPGFARFLQPRPVAELLPAAAKGPVVLLNVTELRSDALILTPDGIEVLPLEGIDPTAVAGQTKAFLEALEGVTHPSQEVREVSEEILASVLGWLGERITGPVLDHLGHTTTPPPGSSWPRVWWCPSGALTLLPLHAAGHHRAEPSGASGSVIDRVISSTTPTLRALLRAHQRPPLPPEQQKMLVVAMPHTPHQSDLPGAGWEATTLGALYPGKATVLGLPGTDPATHDTVLAALPGHPLVHFACHGHSDLANPSASHLLLNDHQTRPLTVLDLIAAHLPAAELAFLSACTTARTG